jgi:dTDP-4-dehydrorhamnose reductase
MFMGASGQSGEETRALKVVLLGNEGQLGSSLQGTLGCFAQVVGFDRPTLDVCDAGRLRAMLRAEKPDCVVNASAYTNVDDAEKDEAAATRVNGDAVGVLGEECKALRAGLVHYSTDFVFDGKSTRAYREDDPTGPLGAYGRSKLAGERALLATDAPAIVLRTAWVYSLGRKSFVSAILRLAREREVLRIVADQVGSPTFAGDLAVATSVLLFAMRRDAYAGIEAVRGVYHLAGTGVTNRYELAKAVVELDPRRAEHKVARVEPINTSDYPLPAARPAFAPLDCTKAWDTLGVRLPDWRETLARALMA